MRWKLCLNERKSWWNQQKIALPYAGGRYTRYTYVCKAQVGCVLQCRQPDKTTRLVRYWSRPLTKAKTGIRINTTQMSHNRMVCVNATSLARRHTPRDPNRSRHVEWLSNHAVATDGLARWSLRRFEFSFDLVYKAHIEPQISNALPRLHITDADTKPIVDVFPIAVIDMDITVACKVRLETYQQALDQVFGSNQSSMGGAASIIAEFLQDQATDPYCIQIVQSIGKANSKYTIDEKELIVLVAPIDGAV